MQSAVIAVDRRQHADRLASPVDEMQQRVGRQGVAQRLVGDGIAGPDFDPIDPLMGDGDQLAAFPVFSLDHAEGLVAQCQAPAGLGQVEDPQPRLQPGRTLLRSPDLRRLPLGVQPRHPAQ